MASCCNECAQGNPCINNDAPYMQTYGHRVGAHNALSQHLCADVASLVQSFYEVRPLGGFLQGVPFNMPLREQLENPHQDGGHSPCVGGVNRTYRGQIELYSYEYVASWPSGAERRSTDRGLSIAYCLYLDERGGGYVKVDAASPMCFTIASIPLSRISDPIQAFRDFVENHMISRKATAEAIWSNIGHQYSGVIWNIVVSDVCVGQRVRYRLDYPTYRFDRLNGARYAQRYLAAVNAQIQRIKQLGSMVITEDNAGVHSDVLSALEWGYRDIKLAPAIALMRAEQAFPTSTQGRHPASFPQYFVCALRDVMMELRDAELHEAILIEAPKVLKKLQGYKRYKQPPENPKKKKRRL